MARSPLAVLCLVAVLGGCTSVPPKNGQSSPSDADKSQFTNNLTGTVVAFPLQTIPRRNQRRYINHAGGEAVVYYYGGKAHILARATERFGDFQYVPYGSEEDPVVLPTAAGQVFVAANDRLLIRDLCPDEMCSSTEFISAPTNDEPLAFDEVSEGPTGKASMLLMVSGTNSVYTYDLLERKWDQLVRLPEGVNAIAVKRTKTNTLVLDRGGKELWILSDGFKSWNQTPLSWEAKEPPTQMEVVGNNLTLATKSALWVANIDSIVGISQAGGSMSTEEAKATWHRLESPLGAQIVQISADGASLYCTTDTGEIYLIPASGLDDPSSPPSWQSFEPALTIPVEHQPIQKLRWIDGELVAFSADGVSTSKNLGMSWQREPISVNQPIRLDEIALGADRFAVTQTDLLTATPAEAKNQQWHEAAALKDGCTTQQGGRADSVPSLEPMNNSSFAIITSEAGSSSQSVCIFDARAHRLTRLSAGWQPSRDPISVVNLGDTLLVGSEHGLAIWDTRKAQWTSSTEISRFDGSPPTGAVTALAHYGTRGVILATESRAIYFREAWDAAHPWNRVSDKFDSVINPINGNVRISSIWANPRRLSEIYLAVNQMTSISLYFRDRADTMFMLYPISGDRATGMVGNDSGNLWITGINNSYYINPNRPPVGSWADFSQHFEDQAAKKLSEPMTWVTGALSSYAIAVLGVLALRLLPVSPVLGRNWLASLVVKPFTVSPILGRWILFLGYRARIQKETLAQELYFGLPATLPDGTSVPPDQEGQILCQRVLSEAARNASLLVTGRPGSGKSMLLTRIAHTCVSQGSRRKRLLPILVTADMYNGDLLESASQLLRQRYGIPLDKEDMLIGQMQVGGILFLFDGLSEVAISRGSAVADLLQVTRMPEFKHCSLIVATRSFEGQPEIPTCQILPVRGEEAIELYLPRFNLPAEERVLVEGSLRAFRGEPVDVQLLTMTIESKGTGSFQRRFEIFQAFFQKRLGAEGSDGAERWAGWSFALENLGKWFCLDTGVKSIGLSQRATVDAMETMAWSDHGKGSARNLVTELRDTFNIEMTSSVAVLNYLRTAGILVRIDRWKFAHDSFEEFFCASFLARSALEGHLLASLPLWLARPEELTEVFRFLSETLDAERRNRIAARGNLPKLWTDILTATQP
jgi:hypothetical protein